MGKVKPAQSLAGLPACVDPSGRRMFLKGASAMLAIPFLPSLFPSVAEAQVEASLRKAVLMAYSHGLYWDNWRPTNVALTQVAPNVRAASLSNATLGPYFPAEFDSIKNKISILEGLDMIAAYGHAKNSPWAAGGQKGGNDWTDPLSPNSIDVLLGKSSSFYPSAPKFRVLRTNISGGDPYSFHYENGGPQLVDGSTDPLALFNQVSAGATNSGSTAAAASAAQRRTTRQKLMVDDALGAIQALLGSSKIAASDKNVASNYFDRLRDVQTRINSQGPGGGAPGSSYMCNRPYSAPLTSYDRMRNIGDSIILALACGQTKLSTVMLPSEHDLVHRLNDASVRLQHIAFLRDEVLFAGSHIMTEMDKITESNGKTMLENSAVLISSDIGCSKFDNHIGANVPVVVGGGLNGKLKMGQYVSYYDTSTTPVVSAANQGYPGQPIYGGRPYNELLITLMRALGLSSSEYVNPANGGFGAYSRFAPGCTDCAVAGAASPNTLIDQYYSTKYLVNNPNRDVTLPYWYMGA